ncbi:MAG: ferritin family protein [Euryarchaeota archaeon]|nr:ferritin family protein [Euryarchaeota archaeon]
MSAARSKDTELDVLNAALAIEEFGIEFYHRLEECIGEEEGKALMRSLARDEAQHRQLILGEISMVAGGKEVVAKEVDLSGYGIVPSKVFRSLPKDRCLTLEEEMEALNVGMEVERNSITMYAVAAKGAVHVGVRERLLQLEGIEKGHLKLLEENAHMLKTGGSWYGYTPILEG